MSETDNGFNQESQGRGRIVLMTAVLCAVLVIVLLIILRLYAEYLRWSQQTQRRREQAQSHRATTHVPALVVGNQVQRPRTGLDPAAVASLPKFAYRKKKPAGDTDAAPDKCSVCLGQLEEGETVRQLPACRHTFHHKCIDLWLYSHNTCPLCRKVVGPFLVSPHL